MRDDNGIRIRILIKALRICHTDINNTIPVLTYLLVLVVLTQAPPVEAL